MLGGLGAGLGVWLLHGAVGALVAWMAVGLREELPLALRAGAGWAVLEWLPGALPLVGMPWFGVAAALEGWPQLLPLTAVGSAAGLGALAAAGWGALLTHRRERRAALATALVAIGVGSGVFLLPSASGLGGPPTVSFAALAWDRTRDETGDPALLEAGVTTLLDELAALDSPGAEALRGARLVGPEAPIPAPVEAEPLTLRWLREVQRLAEPVGAVVGVHALVGGFRYNTLVRLGEAEEAPEGVHRKRHLVPGVERTVLSGPGRGEGRGLAPGRGALPFAWGTLPDAPGGASAPRGAAPSAPLRVGGIICVEILYPAEVARLRRRGAQVLVQATSDAMLRPGGPLPVLADAGRRQHAAMLRIRAAEFRIPVVRSALGAEAGAVDAVGRPLVASADVPLSRGGWRRFEVTPALSAPPPSAWIAPAVGPLALGLLLVVLVFRWRRGEVLGWR